MLMLRMFSRSMLGLRIFACLERLSRFARQSGTLVQIRIRLRLFRLSTFSFVLFRHVLIRRLCLLLVVCSFHSKSNNLRQPTRFVLLFESPRQPQGPGFRSCAAFFWRFQTLNQTHLLAYNVSNLKLIGFGTGGSPPIDCR